MLGKINKIIERKNNWEKLYKFGFILGDNGKEYYFDENSFLNEEKK